MIKKLSALGLLISVMSLSLINTAAAHVTVRPAEVVTAGFQTFTVSAPNEKDRDFTGVKLLIPDRLRHVSPSVKAGWQVQMEKEGEGDAAVVKSITWSGGRVAAGLRDDFTFSAQAPAETTELQWKAYQIYEGGETVAWDLTESQQPKKADGSPDFSRSGPLSVTTVVNETEAAAATRKAEQAAAEAKKAASRAQYLAIAAVVLGLTGVFLATRKRTDPIV